MTPILYLVIPCYNEEQVLPITAPIFVGKLGELIEKKEISEKSRVLFVNDGSSDSTWEIIEGFSKDQTLIKGICLSRNMGHQNALLAGLMTAKDECDVTVSIDCDGQDDINAVDKMIAEYKAGCDIVYVVRESRKTDSFFKRHSAQFFYKLLNRLGAKTVYNHADYRLMSARALNELEKFKEVNIYLRGMVPMVGFRSTCVTYDRTERLAGKSKYPLKKMLKLAANGITNLSVKPIHLIFLIGIISVLLSLAGIIWSVVAYFLSSTVAGWSSIIAIICFFGGIQILCIGVIGEYIGKIYMETKARPRYIISKKTDEEEF
ncbi:MAG: glycosyltransferase family 2 protein [Clostridia bacterium]|nr:glycosyltransferase family 2 protein [Clostridia bacterium]